MRLIDEGRQVYRLLRTHSSTLGPSDHPVIGDLGDPFVMRPLLERCHTVFHLASSTTPGSSARHPVMEVEHNLLPTLRLLEILQDFPETRLAFISSGGAVYGNPGTHPVPETQPLAALSHYGAGKIALEAFFRSHGNATGSDIFILRPSNIYGPGQALKGGFGLVRTMLEHLRLDESMEIWGDGEAVRDFLYIDDMVDACSRILHLNQKCGTFNVGAGQGHSINSIKTLVEQVTGKQLHTVYRPGRATDVRHIVLDYSAFRNATGWLPSVPLDQGIARTWQWLTTT